MDQQVKIRGFRIELGEIEGILRQHSRVKEAAVVPRKEANGGKRLVAYFTQRGTEKVTIKEMRRWIADRLPDYMIPNVFVQLEALPLTPGGKLDRRALPEPNDGRPELDQPYVAPRNSMEETLAKVWAEVLGIDRVGIFDSFFELGGHSLLATRVLVRIRERLKIDLTLTNLFELPTVAALAETLAQPDNETQAASPDPDLAHCERLSLSPQQKRIWFLDEFEPRRSSYNLVCGLKTLGQLNPSALEQACRSLARRYPVLRSAFPVENGEPIQCICKPEHITLLQLDFSNIPVEQRESQALTAAQREARRTYITSRPCSAQSSCG